MLVKKLDQDLSVPTQDLKQIAELLMTGAISILPTDTLYGFSVDATNINAVTRVREIKNSHHKAGMLIIPPHIEWIKDNLRCNDRILNQITNSKGQESYILKKKDPSFMQHLSQNDSLGIRISKNKFITELFKYLKVPITSTSVNISQQDPVSRIDFKSFPILKHPEIKLVVDAGQLVTKPSVILDWQDFSNLKIIRGK